MSRKLFQAVYLLPILLGPAVAFWFFSGKAYETFLFWWGIGHMILLILTSFLVESGYKNRAGVDVQYAGYIWTLIGVGAILLSFSGKEIDVKLLDIFLYGAGLAILTSILGWTIGGWLENREQAH